MKVIREVKASFERRLARGAHVNPKRYYRYVQSKTKIRCEVTRILRTNGVTLESDCEIAEAFSGYFASVYRQDTGIPVPIIEEMAVPTMPDVTVTIEEVHAELKRLDSTKAEGQDELHPMLLGLLSDAIAEPLTEIFNDTLYYGALPSDWRKAIVTPIFKSGEKEEPCNYRSVSLTSVPCKVLERILRKRICEHLMRHNLANQNQHGFLPGQS